ncbi:hypothetical protein PO124_03775 [Bacillus licheniformis]|nr:hypothetical protein [Bacillus licheniformis]
MFRSLNSYLIDFTGLVVISVLICLVSAGGSLASGLPFQIPASVLQLNTISSAFNRSPSLCVNRSINRRFHPDLCD